MVTSRRLPAGRQEAFNEVGGQERPAEIRRRRKAERLASYNMTRVKRGVRATQRRKRLLKHTKGFLWTRKSKPRQAREALLHAWSFQFADRKKKKRTMRNLWTIKINAAARNNGITYSKLINQLKKADIQIDRKILAVLAEHNPDVFKQILESAK